MKNKKKYFMFLIGLAVTCVALYYSTRQVRPSEFISHFRHYRFLWLIPALAIFYYGIYLRAVRWGLLFRPHFQLKGYQLIRPIMICFGFNSLFPARVGEFARAIYVGKRERTGVTTALATVFTERVIDGVTLLAMLAFSLWWLPPMDLHLKIELWGFTVNAEKFNHLTRQIIAGCLGLTAAVIIFMIPLTQRILIGLIQRMPLPARVTGKLVHLFQQFARGFHALREPAVLARIIFHSVILWLTVAVSNMMVAYGFGLAMNLPQAMALMTLIGIFILIPAAPGYWGLYEVGAIFALIVLNVVKQSDRSLALAYAIMIHLVQYIPLVVFALIFAWQAQFRPADAALETTEAPADEQEILKPESAKE